MRHLACVGALLLCAGCNSTNMSEDFETGEMFPGIEVKPDGTNTMQLEIRLSLEGDRYAKWVELSEGDRFRVTVAGETREVSSVHGLSILELGDHVEDLPIEVAFVRDEGTSAPISRVTVPARLDMMSPSKGESYSRSSDDIQVTWSPSGMDDEIVIDAGGNCAVLEPLGGMIVPDTGSYAIEPGLLVDQAGGSCDLQVDVARRRHGVLDDAFAGGHIWAEWRETARGITSTP